MLKRIIISCCTILFAVSSKVASAQSGVSVSGKLVDSTDKPLKLNSLALLKSSDKGLLLVKEITSDSSGAFKFALTRKDADPGSFQILVLDKSSNKSKVYKEFAISDGVLNYDLGTIIVKTAPITLNEIKVLAARPLYNRRLDKLVVNVDNSILASGNNLGDILTKLPGIKVDQTGAITINGKQGIQITIDGKGQYVDKEQIQVLLSTIKSESIKQLEIIANPSAKYDANQGSVINIVTKKNYSRSDVHVTYGSAVYPENNVSGLSYPNISAGTNLNYKAGNFASNFSINYSYAKQFRNNFVQNDYFPNLNSSRQDSSLALYHEKKLDTHLGLSYDLNRRSFLSLEFLLVKNFQREYDNTDHIAFLNSTQKIDSVIHSGGAFGLNHFYTYGLTLQYSLDLDTVHNKHLDVYYDRTVYHSPSFNNVDYYSTSNNGTSSPVTGFNSNQLYQVSFNSYKTDYKQNLGKNSQLFAGIKYSSINSLDSLKANDLSAAGNYTLLSQGIFRYTESIFGEYVMLNYKLGVFEGQAGLRSEYTEASGNLDNGPKIVSQHYNNLFPSVNLLASINNNNKVTVSYNKRIVRVGFNNLNPLLNYSSPFVITQGSPALQPQFINYFEISYQYKELYLSATYSSSSNSRFDIPILTSNPLSTTAVFQNVKEVKTNNFNAEYPFSITKWWSLINDASLSRNQSFLPSETLTYWSYNLSTYQHFTLDPTLSIDLSGNYNSKSQSYYSTTNSLYSIDLGVKKSLMAKRLDLALNCTDFLGTSKFRISSIYPTQTTNMQSLKNNRFVNLTLKYNFNTGVAFGRRNSTSKGDFGEKRF